MEPDGFDFGAQKQDDDIRLEDFDPGQQDMQVDGGGVATAVDEVLEGIPGNIQYDRHIDDRAGQKANIHAKEHDQDKYASKVNKTMSREAREIRDIVKETKVTLERIVTANRKRQDTSEMGSAERILYETMDRLGIDLYERRINSWMNDVERQSGKVQAKLNGLNDILYSTRKRSPGYAPQLEQDRDNARDYANLLKSTDSLIKEYGQEIERLKTDRDKMDGESKSNPGMDYSDEKEHIQKSIRDLQKRKTQKEFELGQYKSGALQLNHQLSRREEYFETVKHLYEIAANAKATLDAKTAGIKIMIKDSKRTSSALRITEDLGYINDMSTVLDDLEEVIGDGIADAMGSANNFARDEQEKQRSMVYRGRVKAAGNEHAKAVHTELAAFTNKYATV